MQLLTKMSNNLMLGSATSAANSSDLHSLYVYIHIDTS